MQYRYRIATLQQGRITHVDGAWIGTIAPTEHGAAETCPEAIDYLNELGSEGWRLVTTISLAQGQAHNLFLEQADA